MREYPVSLQCKVRVDVIVTAENPDAAYDKAFDTVYTGLHSGGSNVAVEFADLDCLEREVEETDYAR